MYKRIFVTPKTSFFLFGPRGTGKSTLLKNHFPKATLFNLLLEREYQGYLVDPESFYNKVQAIPKGQWVIVDEIQRIPELLNYIHQLIEEKKWNFVLTGSSARKLRKAGTNLLAGRAITKHLFPFLPAELGQDFSLSEALRYGTLPIVWDSTDRNETLRSYVETYLRHEIKEEALVKNLAGFARFLQVASLYHAQTLNISNVARDCEVARMTVNSFFEILEDTLIGFRLYPFTAKLKIRESQHPKFYFCDSGLVRALKNKYSPVHSDETGPLFEGFILHMLRSYQSYDRTIDDIFYWRPAEATQTEVDFLVKKGDEFCAIEVKSTSKLRPTDLKGLRAIEKLPGLKRRILIYTGKDAQLIEKKIEIMNVQNFSKALSDGLF